MKWLRANILYILYGLLGIWLASRYVFWGDELYSIIYAKQSLFDFFREYLMHPDNHPPLYYVILNLWQKIAMIQPPNDWLFRVPSVIFHVLALKWVAQRWTDSTRVRRWFLLLAGTSAFLMLFSGMVRYYTLGALVSLICLTHVRQWLQTGEDKSWRRSAWWSLLLAYTDYPLYVLLIGFLMGWIIFKKSQFLGRFIKTAFWQLLGIAPLLYLNAIYFLFNDRLNTVGQGAGWLKNLVQALIGLDFIPYHWLVGDFFHPVITPLLIVGLLGLLVQFLRGWKTGKEAVLDRGYVLSWICYSIIAISFLLSFLIGRYPIFSYGRFIMPSAYLMYLLLAEVLVEKSRLALILLLMLNISVVGCNQMKSWFINPTYFLDTHQFKAEVAQVERNREKKFHWVHGDILLAEKYFLVKQYPDRYKDQADTPGLYGSLIQMRMRASTQELTGRIREVEKRFGLKHLETRGFDRISDSVKSLLRKAGLMTVPYKFYLLVFEKE